LWTSNNKVSGSARTIVDAKYLEVVAVNRKTHQLKEIRQQESMTDAISSR
jgi:hypothetical protein